MQRDGFIADGVHGKCVKKKKKEKKKGEKKKKTESNKLYRFGIGYLHDTMHGHVQIIQQLIHFIS